MMLIDPETKPRRAQPQEVGKVKGSQQGRAKRSCLSWRRRIEEEPSHLHS